MRAFAPALALAVALAASAAQAQNAAPPTMPPEVVKLRDFVKSPDYIRQFVGIVTAGEKDIPTGCAAPKPLDRVGFIILKPPVFVDGTAHPVSGSWRDRLAVDRCGTQVIHNVLFVARDKGMPALGLLLPGNTGAMPQMQQGILKEAAPAVMAKAKCKDPKTVIVANTETDPKNPGPKFDAQGKMLPSEWNENWSFYACGKSVKQAVTYQADGQGKIGFKIDGAKKK